MKAQVKMIFKRSTKNTHLFTNEDNEVTTAIYIKKEVMKDAPKVITVTIEA